MLSRLLSFTRSFTGNAFSGNTMGVKESAGKLYAPGTQIPYDPLLVNRLKHDHKNLVEMFLQITRHAQADEYRKIKHSLDNFFHEFNAHVLLEYTKLYVFLDYSFKNNSTTHELVGQFRKEMNLIGKAVRKFHDKWSDVGFDANNISHFKAEIQGIGEVLVKRIKTEEDSLYEIYDTAPGLIMLDAALVDTELGSHPMPRQRASEQADSTAAPAGFQFRRPPRAAN